MSFPERAALLARLALMRPEDQVRLPAFRETFLARLAPERLRVDLRNLGILFGLAVAEIPSFTEGEGPAPSWPIGLRAAGDDLRSSQQLLLELAQGLLAAAPPGSGATQRRARAMREIAGEIGRLADRLAALRPKRGKASRKTPPEGPA
jgi:hypothetical protein